MSRHSARFAASVLVIVSAAWAMVADASRGGRTLSTFEAATATGGQIGNRCCAVPPHCQPTAAINCAQFNNSAACIAMQNMWKEDMGNPNEGCLANVQNEVCLQGAQTNGCLREFRCFWDRTRGTCVPKQGAAVASAPDSCGDSCA